MGNVYKSLSIDERVHIHSMLEQNKTPYAIAKFLERSPSSITREIANHCIVEESQNDCLLYLMKECKERNACKKACNHKLCRLCKSVSCIKECSNYVKSYCDDLENSASAVCNGCDKMHTCKFDKRFYNAVQAEKMAKTELHDKRSGFDYTELEIKTIDKIISPLIKNGQSPYAALQSATPQLQEAGIRLSKNTLYNLIGASMLSCRNIDLPEKVSRRDSKLRKRNRKEKYAILTVEKAGHMYGDYLKYLAKHDIMTVEMDCVEGKKSDNATLLTLHWRTSHMQIAILMPNQTAGDVVDALDKIEESLGYDLFCEMFPLILTDNGHEFTDINGMERSCTRPDKKRTMIFFCEPNRSDQKGSCERNHRVIRKIIPKGTSLEPFTQSDITKVTNHVNSYVRDSLNGKCPYDVAKALYPKDFFTLLGLEKIPANQVVMKKDLLYRKVS